MMLKPTRPMLVRTAYCLDKLRLDLGIGAPTIFRRVWENQYKRFGLTGMSYEGVRDLFRLRESPGVDPPMKNDPSNDPPWLFALELEFPGSTNAFFHPAFDLFWGQVESKHYWHERAQKIPVAWIEQAKADGRLEIASEWQALNSSLGKRGRRKERTAPDRSLRAARTALLRLPAFYLEALFRPIHESGYVSRLLGDPHAEVRACLETISLDSLAALMCLLLEANEITDWNRFHVVRRALRAATPKVAERPECRRIVDALPPAVRMFCSGMTPYQNPDDGFYDGKPLSWRYHLAPSLS